LADVKVVVPLLTPWSFEWVPTSMTMPKFRFVVVSTSRLYVPSR
jgi:hypothetical protein